MSILTWAMSDNAPIDPELPDAVKAWNDRYASPKLVITSVKQFFNDFETCYKTKIPTFSGDYTEYWTDGVSSAAKETGLSRTVSDKLKQVEAIWAIRRLPAYPVADFENIWKNLLLFNEHTWGAYNSVSEPDNTKVKSEWAVKRSYVLNAKKQLDSLAAKALTPLLARKNAIDVYNTTIWLRTGMVYIPADLSGAGDLVRDASGKKIPSQRLNNGDLAMIAANVPPMGKNTYTINPGKAFLKGDAKINGTHLTNGLYTIDIATATGNIKQIRKGNSPRNYVSSDSVGFNEYVYLSGDSLNQHHPISKPEITIGDHGPLVVSVLIKTAASGTNALTREVRLISGLDQAELINTVDKMAVRKKESVHFAFPFFVPHAQVTYNIPWGSIRAESDQLPYSNRNWYRVQRWVDISNADYGVTWSTPDAPLFEIGKANLPGDLKESPDWLSSTSQSSLIYSWVMNNIWHTNFKADQEGIASFHYFIKIHDNGYNSEQVNRTGLENHQPLMVTAATGNRAPGLFFKITGESMYVEAIKPTDDGLGVIIQIVSTSQNDMPLRVVPQGVPSVKVWESNLTEDRKTPLNDIFILHAKSVMSVRIDR